MYAFLWRIERFRFILLGVFAKIIKYGYLLPVSGRRQGIIILITCRVIIENTIFTREENGPEGVRRALHPARDIIPLRINLLPHLPPSVTKMPRLAFLSENCDYVEEMKLFFFK